MYQITIIEVKRVPSKRSERRVKTEVLTDEQVNKMDYWMKGQKAESKNPPTIEQSYYVEVDSTEKVETEVLKQCTEDLDLPAVIKAINKL